MIEVQRLNQDDVVDVDGAFHAPQKRWPGDNRRVPENVMPIYEYACQDCGREFEALVRSDTVPACPACRSTQLAKRLSVFATAASGAEAAPVPAMTGPCGTCGHPDGPGSCSIH